MKRIVTLGAVLAVGLALSGCASGNTDPARVLEALGKNYAHCERVVNYSASIGPLNPGSGATINGSVRCPPLVAVGSVAAPVAP